MKRRFLIIILAVLFCALLIMTIAGKAAVSSLQTCIIQYDKLISEYTVSCQVRGQWHYQYFDGMIIDLQRQTGERLKKDDVILKYTDSRGRSVSLKAQCDGLLLSAESGVVIIEDEQLRLYGSVPMEKYDLVKTGQQGSFTLQGVIHLAEVEEKRETVGQKPDQRIWQLIFKTDDGLSLHSGQKVNVLMPLQQLYGLCVDAGALLVDEEGYFLLDSSAANDLTDWSSYRLNVEVIAQSEGKAIVRGVQLENREVLLLPPEYWQVLGNAD